MGAAILAVSVLPLPRGLRGVKPLLVLEGVLLTLILGLGLSALFVPSLVPAVPAANTNEAKLLLAVGLALFAILAMRAVPPPRRRSRRGRTRALRGALPRLARQGAHDELGRRDAYTEQHTRCVALRVVQVGERLGLSKRHLRSLAIGGLLHDIGKLAVPDVILKKPGPLDDAEYAVVQRHPEWGTRLLDQIGGFPKTVKRLVRDHHERLDGQGYPNGLTADAIDLDTRILAVCDVYDALISSRVYRPPWTHQEAMALLREQAGAGFDPRCVNALAEVLDREAGHEDELGRARANAAPKSLPGPPATAWAS